MVAPSSSAFQMIPRPDLDGIEDIQSPQVSHTNSSDSSSNDSPFKRISPGQLAKYLTNPECHDYEMIVILDARYDYEFEGGRIVGAHNITSEPQMRRIYEHYLGHDILIVFHCEFSHNRGPTLMSLFRSYDRKRNTYPNLNYKNICLLEGGYKCFYQSYPNLCCGSYVPMWDPNHIASGDLRRSHSSHFANTHPRPQRKLKTCLSHGILFRNEFLSQEVSLSSPSLRKILSHSSSQPLDSLL